MTHLVGEDPKCHPQPISESTKDSEQPSIHHRLSQHVRARDYLKEASLRHQVLLLHLLPCHGKEKFCSQIVCTVEGKIIYEYKIWQRIQIKDLRNEMENSL